MNRLFFLFFLFLLAASALSAQTSIRKVPVEPASPSAGPAMFKTWCASCHGLDGRGRGPAAPALKSPVPDLTTLAARNSGVFPELRVVNSVNGEISLPAHGSKDMPVWGYIFREMKPGSGEEAALRLRNLTRYIESLQPR
jgi:mono/diheme cytochrome c family protein